ncbi:MAG TPA: wax ester/triacylglycerol synthase family O-acyltransferase [Candidatus Limnocylindrales bacterium]|nr:wax ester/triacylglycerol synthase family O-acyltransferase [Candidatus Limnocylindrales bacterium]
MARYAYEPLTAADNAFLALEDGNAHMHIGAVTVFETASLANESGGVDIGRIRSYVASRLDQIPRYRQRLDYVPIERLPVWVDDDHFNIAYHVRHTSLPRPGTTEQLKLLAGRIDSQGLDRSKPLWEFWVVEGLEGGRHFAVIQKVHHCMIDGISGVDLMAVLLNPFPTTTFLPPRAFVPRPAPSPVVLAAEELWRRVARPVAALASVPALLSDPSQVVREVVDGVEGVAETLTSTIRPASPTPWNQPIGPHRRLDWLALPLEDIKAVKNALGGTVNDVVLATVAGAVRTFLEHRGINPDFLRIRANVPVSVRSTEERGHLGNRIALWMTDLPVDEADPVTRLDRIRATTARLKESKQALGAQVLASVSDMTTWRLLSLAVRLSTRSRPFNLVVTNVPGPQLELYLLDAPLRQIYPMVNLLENQGLGVALFSYMGTLYWGVLADWDLVPDLHVFVEAIRESFVQLQKAARMELAGQEGPGMKLAAR